MNPERLETLIQDLCEGCINENDLADLETELQLNSESMQKYIDHCDLDNLIYEVVETNRHLQTPVIPIERVLHRQKRKIAKWAGLGAAAMISITLTLLTLYSAPAEDPNLIAFTVSPGSTYSVNHLNKELPTTGTNLQIGSQLNVQQGAVELTFKSGVKSVILAPASVTLTEANAISLENGVAWFEVPQKAVGFKVQTKDFNVVDLSTEFGISTNKDDLDELHVIKGKVQVTTRHRRKKSAILTTGQARRYSGVGGLDTIPMEAKHFLTSLPSTLPHLHLNFDNIKHITEHSGSHSIADIKLLSTSPKPLLTEGKFNSALRFDKAHKYIATDWEGISGSRPRSVAFWIKMPKSRQEPHKKSILSWGTQQTTNTHINSKWAIFFNVYPDSKPIFHLSFGGFWYYCPDTILDDDQWHHVAVVYDGEPNPDGTPAARIYVDGVKQAMKTDSHPPLQRDENGAIIVNTEKKTPFQMGRSILKIPDNETIRDHEIFTGSIDELYIIQGIISQEAVFELMTSNKLHPSPTKQLDKQSK